MSPSSACPSSVRAPDRLQALYQYDVLDTPPERAFDHIAELAAHLFDTPTALVSLVDHDRQWFKACIGFNQRETGLDVSFCKYTITSDAPLIVEDAAQDARFADHPAVTGTPGIRFYAGAPLRTPDGHGLGSLCVIDTQPHAPADAQIEQLERLAAIVMDEMELRREVAMRRQAEDDLRRANITLNQAQELTDSGCGIYDLATGTFRLSEPGQALLGLDPAEDYPTSDLFNRIHPADRAEAMEAFEQVLRGTPYDFEHRIYHGRTGEMRWLLARGHPIRNDNGTITHLLGAAVDITERKRRATIEQRFGRLLDSSAHEIYIFDAESHRIIQVNQGAIDNLGYTEAELHTMTPLDLIPEDEQALNALLDPLRDGRDLVTLRTTHHRKDGTTYPADVRVQRVSERDGDVYLAIARDITEQQAAEDQLRYRAALERLIAQLSTRFINTSADEVDAEIEAALADLGRFIGVDRSYVFLLHDDATAGQRMMGNTHEWCAQGIAPQQDELQRMPCSALPWWMARLDRNEPVNIPDVAALPPDADAERAMLQEQDIEALVAVPMTWEGDLLGFVGFDVIDATKVLPANTATLLRVVGDLFVNALKQRETHLALHESQERLELALSGADLGLWDWNVATGEVVFNDRWAEMLGYRLDEIKPHVDTWAKLVHPDDLDDVQRVLQNHLDGKTDFYETVHRMRAKDGSWRWILDLGKVVERAEDGTPLRATGIHHDITERRRAQDALRERKAQLSGLANSIPGVVFQFYARDDGSMGLHFVSQHAESLLGLSSKPDGFFERFYAQIKPSHQDAFMASVEAAVQNAAPWDFEMPFQTPEGESLWLHGLSTPVRRANEIVFNGVVLDVTERKQFQEELVAAKDKAEEMSRLKSAFLANMSHEIRTPLTSIIGFAEVLDDLDLEPPADQFTGLIHESGRRLLDTLNSVLDLSQLEAGLMRLNPTEVALRDEVQSTLALLGPRAEKKQVTLQADLPDTPLPATLDCAAFQRIVTNLLANAVKFTDTGGHVSLRLAAEDSTVCLRVEDTGVGIDPDFLPHLFDAFQQESTGNGREFEGSGLGLTITKELVDLMGGTIEVDSVKGEGTMFTVRLPRHAE